MAQKILLGSLCLNPLKAMHMHFPKPQRVELLVKNGIGNQQSSSGAAFLRLLFLHNALVLFSGPFAKIEENFSISISTRLRLKNLINDGGLCDVIILADISLLQ